MATTAGERVQQVLRQGEPTERYVLSTFCAWGFPVPLSGLCRTADEGLWGAGFTTGDELHDYLSEMVTYSLLTWDRTGFIYLLPDLVHPLQRHLSGDMREEGARRARQVIAHLDEHSRYPYRPHLTNIADQYESLGMDWSVE